MSCLRYNRPTGENRQASVRLLLKYMTPLLELTTLQKLLRWYETNLCSTELIDPRGYRVRFHVNDFIHLKAPQCLQCRLDLWVALRLHLVALFHTKSLIEDLRL